jgi:hypothetical protein
VRVRADAGVGVGNSGARSSSRRRARVLEKADEAFAMKLFVLFLVFLPSALSCSKGSSNCDSVQSVIPHPGPPYCMELHMAPAWCSDVGRGEATCRDGEWICPRGMLVDVKCRCIGGRFPCTCGKDGWECPPPDGGSSDRP